MTGVADRYTSSHEKEVVDCPSCGAKDIPYPIHNGDENGDKIECPKCYVKPKLTDEYGNVLGLGQLTDKYINQGMSDDDAFDYACQDTGFEPKNYRRRY